MRKNSPSGYIVPDSELDLTSENPVQNKVIAQALNNKSDKQVIESYTVNVSDWSSISGNEPFTYECTVSPTYDVGDNTLIELFMDDYQNTLFAKYGFSINYFNTTTGELYIQSIGLPDSSITFKVGFVG